MSYEQFRSHHRRNRRGSFVSITKIGRFTFSIDCQKQHLNGYKSVFLFYDPEQKYIGIKPTNEKSKDTRKILVSREKNPIYTVSGKAFLKHFGINHSKLKKYGPVWNDELKMLEIDLNNPQFNWRVKS